MSRLTLVLAILSLIACSAPATAEGKLERPSANKITATAKINEEETEKPNHEPSGWKDTESTRAPAEKSPEPLSEKQPAYSYPAGIGPVLLNGCLSPQTANDVATPCLNGSLLDPSIICARMMDSANYIGVGFDGRGYYRSESRRGSLIQRTCAKKSTFMGQDVPDTMNVFGIFETVAETKSFQSVDEYISYIRNKAGLSDEKNVFSSEASRFSKASSVGVNLGGIGAQVGAGIGAVVGGPVGVGLGTTQPDTGSGSASQTATDSDRGSPRDEQIKQSFFAVMYVNVVLYDISLDVVRPTDINLAALRDYMSLPVSYESVGSDVKYQNFLLRWGTHFVRSAKFGGQLKITKTSNNDKVQTEQEFASIAETEFQSMFATLQSKYTQESRSLGILGFGGQSKESSQSSSAQFKSGYTATLNAKNLGSQAFRQSEFTQTTVEAQGGTPKIAEALVHFYKPSFEKLYHEWITSIKDYAKPFDFQLRPISEIFDLNMDSLFPAGNVDFGCVGRGKVEILIDPETRIRYYFIKTTTSVNNITIEKRTRVNCKYRGIKDFQQDMERRKMSLEKAVGIYMTEGPSPTSSFDLSGGQPGCEEATAAQFNLFSAHTKPLKFVELLKQPFIIAFDLPAPIPNIVSMNAKYTMSYRFERWFAVEPTKVKVNLYDGCQIANVKPTDTKVCFRNIILTYEESTGFFRVDSGDFAASKQRIPSLPYWLSGTTVARLRKVAFQFSTAADTSIMQPQRPAIPCNVKWVNSHRLDPSKPENCIHFTSASEGDLFVIFASIPRDKKTWYYLQITTEGVNFYQMMALQKSDLKKGMGLLGEKNLYQSFFVCVIQNAGSVTMQYGKADTDSEVGTVYSLYTFPPDSKSNLLTFYSFGTGTKPVSLMDVRLTKKMPEVACLGDEYVKKEGKCVLDCHVECNGCRFARDNKACRQCKNVRTETGSGTDKVTECIPTCPAGKYLSDTIQGLCVPCTSGTFKDSAGNQKCRQCLPGSFSPDGATSCSGCPAGTFSNSAGSQQCVKCPAGKFAASGASSCSDCPTGSFSEAGQAECNPCPYGHFGNTVGMSACQPCSAGFYTDTRGMTACTKCPAGSSSAQGSRSCDNNCLKGEFSPRIRVACAKCPAGTFAESKGSAACSQCAIGYYQPSTGQARCLIAPKGSFVAQRGASAFQPCPAGTFNDKEGQTSSKDCRPCAAGSYSSSAGSTACTPCPGGQYQPSTGQASCIVTDLGYYTYTGASAQSKCPPGYIAAQKGASSCAYCSPGTYAPVGSSVCSSCSDFQTSGSSAGACTDCPFQALARSDRISCYHKARFLSCSSGGVFAAENVCEKAIDSSRAWPPYISQKEGTKSWTGFLAGLTNVRKIVLWRRVDCCTDQFINLGVTVVLGRNLLESNVLLLISNPNRLCGKVTSADKPYAVIDCNYDNVIRVVISADTTNPYIAFAEVEVYAD